MIKIDLTESDARLFAKFRKHQTLFELMEDRGIFEIQSGKAVMSFNADGVLTDIDIETKAYKRKSVE